ncbi:MAG: EF-hand domain-containing protein [Pelagibaca sp.]
MTLNKQVSALIIAALAASGIATTVAAQDDTARTDRRAQVFAELDTDGDGVVSAEEFANPPSRFEIADANKDGLVSADELAALSQQRSEQRIARMITRMDTDGDGALSEEEFAARQGAARMFDRLDANEDGAISEEEFAEMRRGDHGGKRSGHWGSKRDGHGNR